MVQNLWTTGFFHASPLPYRLVKIFLLYSRWCFWPFPLSIQFHALLFVLIAVFHKNTPNTGCPVLGVHITVYLLFIILWIVCLLHQSTYSLVTPHRFVRLLFGKTSQNWCSCGVVPQISPEFCLEIHRICVLILHFTAQSASSWGA